MNPTVYLIYVLIMQRRHEGMIATASRSKYGIKGIKLQHADQSIKLRKEEDKLQYDYIHHISTLFEHKLVNFVTAITKIAYSLCCFVLLSCNSPLTYSSHHLFQ